jgi:uncharacterized hydrophobic protein (TIGR00271 family)
MIAIRLVVPNDLAGRVLDMLCEARAVTSVVHLEGAAHKPPGDVILADVAREDASVIVSSLKELGIQHRGTIALEVIDSAISDEAERAEKEATGLPSDAVVWEEVEARASENTELGVGFLLFMVIATLIAAIGVMTDSPILIIGAMVVGPEFGPLAGVSVAIVEQRRDLAKRSLMALAVGFPVAIGLTYLATLAAKATGIAPDAVSEASRPLTQFISNPDAFSVIVAFLAGVAGILSLTSAKSGALIGVLISVTTIPAAGNIAVAAAYGDWDEFKGAVLQLSVNLVMLVLAGLLTLTVQRRVYIARRQKHLHESYRESAGLPLGRRAAEDDEAASMQRSTGGDRGRSTGGDRGR